AWERVDESRRQEYARLVLIPGGAVPVDAPLPCIPPADLLPQLLKARAIDMSPWRVVGWDARSRRLRLRPTRAFTDITGLATATSLRELNLLGTHVSDVTPLAGLTNLESLRRHRTQVSDVTPLAGLTNLESLYLQGTQMSDVTPLAGLTNLRVLSLAGTQVSDLTPLAGLANLQYLDFSRGKVSRKQVAELRRKLPGLRR
ncbi:MAG TPA: hypothetical protein QGH10_03645, partial [Armatimonadota bacterium]|nr:hypothetical protein [Armatimonadota bacterium]